VATEPLPDPVVAARRRAHALIARVAEDAGDPSAVAGLSHAVLGDVEQDIHAMQNGWLMTRLEIHSPRPHAGKAIIRGRQLVQRLLHPLPQRQSEYNLAVNRIVSHLLRVTHRQALALERIDELVQELDERVEQLEQRLAQRT
jgi:hypothetical protein